MNNTEVKKNYNSIDILKLVCAFLVVGIHTEPFSSWKMLDWGFGIITRCAVPVFFMVSSFLLFKKYPDRKKLGRYVFRIACMYVFWIVVYALLNVKDELVNFSFLNVFRGGGYSSLWFLQALIISVPLVFALNCLIKDKRAVFGICSIIYIIGLILGTYYVVFARFSPVEAIHNSAILSYIGTRNGVFYAPVYIGLGLLVSDSNHIMKRRDSFIGVVFSLILLVAETALGVVILKVNSTVMWLMMVPLTYFIFQFTMSFNLKNHKAYSYVRKMSTGVYVTHRICMKVLSFLGGPLFYIGVLALSCTVSFVIALIPRDKVKFINYIC